MAETDLSLLSVHIITAKDCSACVKLKSKGIIDEIVKGLKDVGVKIVQHEASSMRLPLEGNDGMTDMINRKFGGKNWFPFFFVLPRHLEQSVLDSHGRDWATALSSVGIYNGKFDGNTLSVDYKYKTMSVSVVTSWLRDYMGTRAYLDNAGRHPQQEPPVIPIARGPGVVINNNPRNSRPAGGNVTPAVREIKMIRRY